jgi:TM2 domain-containing membrane protein YozV
MSQEVNVTTGNQRNLIVALLLWFFLGYGISAHNYYLGRTGVGITQLVLAIIGFITFILGIGILILAALGVWWLIDLIYVFKLTSSSNVISVNTSKSSDSLDELEKLHNLYEKKIISEEQYEKRKQDILNKY